MIDIHCHILPGVDDGAKDMNMSLDMARVASEQGITHILCTPHHRDRHYINTKQEVERQVVELQTAIDQAGIDLQVFPCQEVHIHGEIEEHLEGDDILFVDLDQTYLLLEFPHDYVPGYANQLIFQLLAKGIQPIIVHPERNEAIMEDPSILEDFVANGCYAQLTAASYAGTFGKEVQDVAKSFIENSLVHFVASDAHRPDGKRGFKMKEVYEQLAKDYGQALPDTFTANAAAIIDGQPIQSVLPIEKQKKKKKGLFGFLRRDN